MLETKRLLDICNSLEESDGKESSFNDRVLIVDSMNTFIRAFAANSYTNDNGSHIGGYTGFIRSVGYAIELLRPTRVIFAFDGLHAREKRKEIFSEYKQQRNHSIRLINNVYLTKGEEKSGMTIQLRRLTQYLTQLPAVLSIHDYLEADDLIYIMKEQLPDSEIIIMSTDKDFLQLIDGRTKVYQPTKKEVIDEQTILERYGMYPYNFGLYKSIEGDTSDNIPGVKGVGLKKLQKNVPMMFGEEKISFEQLIDFCKQHSNFTTDTLLKCKDQLLTNLQLIDFRYQKYNKNTLRLIEQEVISSNYHRLNISLLLKFILEDKIGSTFKNPIEYFRRVWGALDTYTAKEIDGAK